MMCGRLSELWLEILSAGGVSAHRWVPVAARLGLSAVAERLRTPAGRAELSRTLGTKPGPPDFGYVEKQLSLAERAGCTLVSISEPAYPPILREIHDPPPLLYASGDAAALLRPALCIVGSRSADRRGLVTAKALAAALSGCGLLVVSGLARGIDGAAHEGGLEGGGSTCAVLGSGLDVPYPPENISLARRIADEGLVLSELALGSPPLRHHFPRRNRILSGLSLGVVVVQARLKSGAMVTAKLAREQDREIFAVPGPVENPLSRGPHLLLKQGAFLVESAEDILASLPPCGNLAPAADDRETDSDRPDLSDLERAVVSSLDLNPKHIDEVFQICNISPASILPLLLSLEMRGVIVACGGGMYALPQDSVMKRDR
jgi:DNA processing protein